MTDERALLAAIWEDPHDDTLRLVYADWLEDHDQNARAEFIRVQCQLALLEEEDETPKRAELAARESQLWKKHAKEWKACLPKLLRNTPFQRGFPHPRRRALTGKQFLGLTAADLAPAPLWDFRINNAEKTIERVVASDPMARVGILEIPAGQFLERAAEVLSAANFRNLRYFSLSANWIGERGVTALVANASVRHLRDLSLYSSDLTDAAVATLVTAPWFPALRGLDLGNNSFGMPGLRHLVEAARGGSLRRLSVRGSTVGPKYKRFDDDALALLFRSPHLAGLRQLDVGINQMGVSGLEVLCSSATSFRLRGLQLDNNSLTDRGAEVLAEWPGLEKVEYLDLQSNQIGRRGALALARSPHLTRVRTLWLMFNPVAEPVAADAASALRERFGDAVKFRW